MFFDILTLFPDVFESAFGCGIIRRAVEKKIISINIDNIRNYARDRHKTVDDYPYGGDPGMVLKPEPVAKAVKAAKKRCGPGGTEVIFLSARGEIFNHERARQLSGENSLVILCGRYKGVDNRAVENYVDREISIGDFVLSGGEYAAMVLIDAITRLLPGVLGNEDSVGDDSFYEGLLSPPSYTRPEVFENKVVPSVLLSGNHREIMMWKKKMAREITKKRRPDLWEKCCYENER